MTDTTAIAQEQIAYWRGLGITPKQALFLIGMEYLTPTWGAVLDALNGFLAESQTKYELEKSHTFTPISEAAQSVIKAMAERMMNAE